MWASFIKSSTLAIGEAVKRQIPALLPPDVSDPAPVLNSAVHVEIRVYPPFYIDYSALILLEFFRFFYLVFWLIPAQACCFYATPFKYLITAERESRAQAPAAGAPQRHKAGEVLHEIYFKP